MEQVRYIPPDDWLLLSVALIALMAVLGLVAGAHWLSL